MKKKKKSNSKKIVQKNNTQYDDIVSRIKSVNETKLLIKALFYGRSGTGKTTLASTFPRPILILDFREEGTDSIKDEEDIKYLSMETWDDVETAYWYLQSGEHNFKTVVLDTVGQKQELALTYILKEEGKDFASMQIRGKVNELMKTWILNYRDLDMNVVFIAQDRIGEVDTEEEDQITPEVGPAVSPGIAKILNAAVKTIGQTYIQEIVTKKVGKIDRRMEYRLRVGPHPYYLTKIRKPKKYAAPDYLIDPSYDKIVEIIQGKYTTAPEVKNKSKKPKRLKGGK